MLVSLGELRGKVFGSVRFEGAEVDGVDEVLYDTPKCHVFSANDVSYPLPILRKVISIAHHLLQVPFPIGSARERYTVEISVGLHEYLSSTRTTTARHR
jgi:hypothetical protein